MKLRRLRLYGFKSFADRTELDFHDGITAIVGPNGCGKSNISDAIRWVLGEQKPSAIRGSRMDEAIFQGTAGRHRLNRAEVGMVVSNEDHLLAVPQDEIEIRRTVHREAGSDYELNRDSVRLKDILELCRDTGLGANAYAIIEQGMVDSILSDRADERRNVFEEAAGIGRYKDRRKVAQRRLDAAQTDLSRLEDLISEVQSKVRSLSRQRRKAERFQEYRKRRLDVEVAVATGELEAVRTGLRSGKDRLEELETDAPATKAALSAAEAELEQRRLEATEAARSRNVAASSMEEITGRISERERDLAVARERRNHAETRLRQIGTERTELTQRSEMLREELASLEVERDRRKTAVDGLAERVAEVQARQQEMRSALAEARRNEEQARAYEEELSERIAHLGADAAAADARSAEAVHRLERLETEHDDLLAELARLDEQGDLFAERTRELATEREELDESLQRCNERVARLRAEEQQERQAFKEAEDRANLLTARLAATEALARDYQGFSQAVAAILTARDQVEGLSGPLADFLDLPTERAAAVEEALGSLLQILVVRDAEAEDRVRSWLEENEPDAGTLALLPESALPRVQALLDALVFGGDVATEPVLLGQRERLNRLRGEVEEAERARDARSAGRESLADRVAEAEEESRQIAARLETVELELRRLQADEAARSGQKARTQQSRADVETQRAGLRAAAEQARAEAESARKEREQLRDELTEGRAERQRADAELADRRSAWEAVRDEESELRITHAREEAGLAELDRRRSGAAESLEHASARMESLDAEEVEHHGTLEAMKSLTEEAGAELDQLFARRDEAASELRDRDAQLDAVGAAARELEERVRELRRRHEEQAEERHRLELRTTEASASERSIRERLEVEWNRPFEQLVDRAAPVEGEVETLRAELQQLIADIERLGPINMLAMEEYEEEKERLDFLEGQRDDLEKARQDLQTAIREINRSARQVFVETFDKIRTNFHDTFQALFEGGSCDVWLEDEEDPLECHIEISASPRGKRMQRIDLLSGGERALTSLALLFAIYLVKPSPFCVLDEVDAPLDEANIARFVGMLQRFKKKTQFVVITHNPRTMESADWIYGVTMEEPGISSIVGVQLDEVLTAQTA